MDTNTIDKKVNMSCGLYRTTRSFGEHVPAGRLVYLHDHERDGATLHVPEEWRNNKALIPTAGLQVSDRAYLESLTRLPAEGFYRVRLGFHCCERQCTHFAAGSLVQLGYNGEGKMLLFKPRWDEAGLHLPELGTWIDPDKLRLLQRLALEFEPQAVPAEIAPAMQFPRLGHARGPVLPN